jgi:hypothetical protein
MSKRKTNKALGKASLQQAIRDGVRYVQGGMVPQSVAAGRVLMHNDVWHGPYWGCGIRGFRAWTALKPPAGFVLCPCGYAGLKHYANKDYVKEWRDPKTRARMQRGIRQTEREWGVPPGGALQLKFVAE